MVWLPMVPGDDREAAAAEALRLGDPRVRSFWDEARLTGRTWGARDKLRLAPRVATLLPPGSPEREEVEAWDPEEQPLWDAAYFFGPRAAWPEGDLPAHDAWCRQFGYSGGEPGANGFFRGAGWEAEVAWSSWREEFEAGMATVRPSDRALGDC